MRSLSFSGGFTFFLLTADKTQCTIYVAQSWSKDFEVTIPESLII